MAPMSRGRAGCAGSSGARSFVEPLEALRARARRRFEHVAAFLHDDGREVELAQRGVPPRGSRLRHRERRVRVIRGGVDAERDDERLAAMLARGGDEPVDSREPRVVTGSRRERDVRFAACAASRPRSRGSAETSPPRDRRAPTR